MRCFFVPPVARRRRRAGVLDQCRLSDPGPAAARVGRRLTVVFLPVVLVTVALTPGLPAADPGPGAEDAAAGDVPAAEQPGQRRPPMRQLGPRDDDARPPSRREIADGRAVVRRRFREAFSHTATAVGARLAAETLLTAATTEGDRTLRWVLLDEARRLGESAGDAGIVSRSFSVASATYDFDDVTAELRSLGQIPVRALDGQRAASLAKAAEQLAARAAGEDRLTQAITAESIAVRAWQRAGNTPAARDAAARTATLERRSADE